MPRRAFILATILAVLGIAPATAQPLRWEPGGQGWSTGARAWMYGFTQGSQIMPYGWFRALERPDGTALFRADGLARFGYLQNPYGIDGLPVGFAIDVDARGMWLGMNCSACHTAEVTYRGTRHRIEGGPASADMQSFIAELDAAIRATLADPQKYARFAARVVPANAGTERARLRTELEAFASRFAVYAAVSTGTATPWGPGRNDAFGMIFNRVAAINLNLPANNRAPEAPVSYPFLWTTHQQSVTQWPGIVENTSVLNRLGRNAGQVLGVFGAMPHLADARARRDDRFDSSVRAMELVRAEWHVGQLTPPRWVGPPPDAAEIAAGSAIYAQNCASCHTDRRIAGGGFRTDRFRVQVTALSEVGTDPLMVQRFATRRVDTSPLDGVAALPELFGLAVIGGRYGREDGAAPYLKRIVSSVLADTASWRPVPPAPAGVSRYLPPATATGPGLDRPFPRPSAVARTVLDGVGLFREEAVDVPGGGYKAGPLNGIWATGPFLHNGSVPTLWHLLLPPGQRPVTFEVGGRELDTENVGLAWQEGTGRFVFDTRAPGNSNAGHLYGTALPEADRRALLAFLKTL